MAVFGNEVQGEREREKGEGAFEIERETYGFSNFKFGKVWKKAVPV